VTARSRPNHADCAGKGELRALTRADERFVVREAAALIARRNRTLCAKRDLLAARLVTPMKASLKMRV